MRCSEFLVTYLLTVFIEILTESMFKRRICVSALPENDFPNWKLFAVASEDKKKGIQVRSQWIVLEETLNMTDSSLLCIFHKHC